MGFDLDTMEVFVLAWNMTRFPLQRMHVIGLAPSVSRSIVSL